jgi:hypothetical protein
MAWKRKYVKNIEVGDRVYIWDKVTTEVEEITKKRNGTITLRYKRPEGWREQGWRVSDLIQNFSQNQRPYVWIDMRGRKQ